MKAEFIPNTPMKMLLEDYIFCFHNINIRIPKWYAFDGLSIPQAFQFLVNMNHTENIKAGLEHDFLYSLLAKDICNKKEADLHLVWTLKTSFFSKFMIYFWVWIFGKFSYHKDSNYKKYEKEIKEYRKKLWINVSIS